MKGWVKGEWGNALLTVPASGVPHGSTVTANELSLHCRFSVTVVSLFLVAARSSCGGGTALFGVSPKALANSEDQSFDTVPAPEDKRLTHM